MSRYRHICHNGTFKTKETKAEFECSYNGEAIGWIDSKSLAMRLDQASEK